MLQAALEYAALGWPVFPCRADKTPFTTHGVLDATTDETEIRSMWGRFPDANIGLDAGRAGLAIADYDPGSNRADTQVFLPTTFLRSRTPRGGAHEFYALDDGEIVAPSASKIAPKVDVRSFNSYVLLPPSRTADGEYTWIERGTATRRTDEFVRLANIAKSKSADRDKWIIDPDLPENITLAEKWLRGELLPEFKNEPCKIATEGKGGDHCAYATACGVISCGISEELAFDLMLQHWNPRCEPPWSGDEDMDHLREKVKHAYSYHTNPPGNLTQAYRRAQTKKLFTPLRRPLDTDGSVPDAGREVSSGRYRVVDYTALQSIKPPSWIIRDFLPRESSALIVGPPGSYKTFLTLDALLSVATDEYLGAGTWASAVEQRGPVLMAVGEGRAGIKSRVAAWSEHWLGGAEIPNFYLADPVPSVLEDANDVEGFIHAFEQMSDTYTLIALDTVSKSMRGADENSAADAGLYDVLARNLIARFGCTVVGIAHTGLENTKRQRGSGAFEGDSDTIMMMEAHGRDARMFVTRQKDYPEWEKPRWRAMEDVGGSKVPVTIERTTEPKKAAAKAERRAAMLDAIMLETLDTAVVAVLASNRRRWKEVELSRAVAARPEITMGSDKVKAMLKPLRETKSAKAHKCFDASVVSASGPWVYVD